MYFSFSKGKQKPPPLGAGGRLCICRSERSEDHVPIAIGSVILKLQGPNLKFQEEGMPGLLESSLKVPMDTRRRITILGLKAIYSA